MSRMLSWTSRTIAVLMSLSTASVAYATTWDGDGILVVPANEGRYVNVFVDADRYEGLALDGLKGFDVQRFTVDAGSTVGCGQLVDADPSVRCWRTGFIAPAKGQAITDATVWVHLYAGSIRQDSVTRVITLKIADGRFQVLSVEDADKPR